MEPIIVGIGELLWDILPSGRHVGGAPANVAYYANCLGAKGIIVSAVGADALGSKLLSHLAAISLLPKYVTVDEKHPTGTSSVFLNGQGKARYKIHPDAAWDFISPSADLQALSLKSHAVCFGTLAQRGRVSRETIRWFIDQTPDTALKVLDINLRSPYYSSEDLKRSLQMANVVKLNEEELTIVAQVLHLSGKEATLLKVLSAGYNLHLVALTKGEHGSILYSQGKVSQHEGIRTNIVDTVGAGDAFVAAMIMGMLNGLNLDAINEYGNRVAGYVCSQAGATPTLRDDLHISRFVSSEKQSHSCT